MTDSSTTWTRINPKRGPWEGRRIIIPERDVTGVIPAPAGWWFHWQEVSNSGNLGGLEDLGEHEYLGDGAEWCDGVAPVIAFGFIKATGIGCAMVIAPEEVGHVPVWVRNFNTGPEGWRTDYDPYFGRGAVNPRDDVRRGADGLGGFWLKNLAYDPTAYLPGWVQFDRNLDRQQ